MSVAPGVFLAWFRYQPEGGSNKALQLLGVRHWHEAVVGALIRCAFVGGVCRVVCRGQVRAGDDLVWPCLAGADAISDDLDGCTGVEFVRVPRQKPFPHSSNWWAWVQKRGLDHALYAQHPALSARQWGRAMCKREFVFTEELNYGYGRRRDLSSIQPGTPCHWQCPSCA